MKPVYFVLFLVLCALIDNALSLSCIANFCEREEMIAKCKLAPKRCPKGYALRRAGLCSCCNVCKKILYEGGDCSPEVPIAGAISDKVVCADGLICRQNICQKSCEGK